MSSPYSDKVNTKLNLESINNYLLAANVKLSSAESEQLNSIFNASDTENAKGEKDGVLTGLEKEDFISNAKSKLAPELFKKINNFAAELDENPKLKKFKSDYSKYKNSTENLNRVKAAEAMTGISKIEVARLDEDRKNQQKFIIWYKIRSAEKKIVILKKTLPLLLRKKKLFTTKHSNT